MELPHLTMYLRRMRRRFPWWMVLVPLAYLLAGVAIVVLRGLPRTFGGLNSGWLQSSFILDSSFMVALGVILAGSFLVYLIIAVQMGRLVEDRLPTGSRWYHTPVSNGAAVAGVLAVTGINAAVPLASLYAYVLLVPAGFVIDGRFLVSMLLSCLRLGHFALCCGCLHLALRGSRLRPAIAPLAALAAVMSVFWDLSFLTLQYGSQGSNDLYMPGPIDMPLPFSLPFTGLLVALGLSLLVLLQYLLAVLSRGRLPGGPRFALVLPVVLIPLYAGFTGFIDMNGGWLHLMDLGGWLQLPLHACLGNIYPDVYICSDYDGFSFGNEWIPGAYLVYGYLTGLRGHLAFAVGMYGVTLLLWIRTTVKCLAAARNPGRATG